MTSTTGSATYSIGEAADVLGISIPTLRLYEYHGLIIPLRRLSGHRRYAMRELERVRRIREVIHSRQYTLESLRNHLATTTHEIHPDCTPDDGATEVPCWMHPSRDIQSRSTRCRDCEVYLTSVENATR
ncbi:MAG: MerR family transcriptional regulator [Bacteroidota bacterium]